MRTRWSVVVLLLVILASVAPLFAQTTITGSIEGKVTNEKGTPLEAVTVIVTSPALIKGQASAITDASGSYRFPALPPGTYAIEAQFPGYQNLKQEGARVRARISLAVNFVLPISEVKEEVTVTAAAPEVSVVSNTVATSFGEHYIDNQPIPANYYNIIQMAPGVNYDYTSGSGSAMLAYGGTEERQNAFTLDGVNVADTAAGQHWVLPSIRWIQEVEVGGLGAAAEFGGYTGGVINAVTKSGGNALSGDVEIQYQSPSWAASNNPDADTDEFSFQDYAVSIGGPVIKDKLWFFVSGEYWKQVTTPYGAQGSSTREIPRILGKLTWQADNNNRLSLMLEYDEVMNENRGVSRFVLPEASSKQEAPGTTMALHWESVFGSDYFLNVKLSGYTGEDNYLPYNGENKNGYIDYWNTEYEFGNQAIRELNDRSLWTLGASFSIFEDDMFGWNESHVFKFGAEYEQAKSSDLWRRNGGFTYYLDSSACAGGFKELKSDPTCGYTEDAFIEFGYGEYDEKPKYSGYHLYAQDSMTAGRWTVNLGVRYGAYDGGWQSGRGTPTVYETSFIDPRIGVVWDIFGNAKSALKAHYGIYHDKAYTYLWDRERSGEAVIPDQDCYYDPDTGRFDLCDEPTFIAADMGEVDQASVDEWLLTYEQTLAPQMVLGVDYINRKFRNIMAMVNTNNDYSKFVATDNPFGGGNLPIYNLNSPSEFELTTENGAYRDMQSVILRFEKRYLDGWSLRSSLVWTDLPGNILKNNGYANEYRDRNGFTNIDGNMDFAYNEWEFKLSGDVDLPWGFQVSGQYSYFSGWYWTPYVRVSGLDYNSSVGRDINLTERGSQQFPSRNLVDLRLSWRTDLGKGMALMLWIQAFNLLNSDTVVDVYNRWGTYYLGDEDPWYKRGSYGDTYQVEAPRQVRLGARWSF
jgi:hypothetical protein